MKGLTVTVLLFTAFFARSALADYWVWVDKNGVTNYSQTEPKNHLAKHIGANGTEDSTVSNEDLRRPGMEAYEKAQMKKKQAREKKLAARAHKHKKPKVDPDKVVAAQRAKMEQNVAALKQKNCQQARRNVRQLERPRVRTKGENGKVQVMPSDQQQQQLKSAREAVQANCG